MMGAKITLRDDAGVERTIATFESEGAPDLTHPETMGALARLRSAATQRHGAPLRNATILTVLLAILIVPGLIFGSIYFARRMLLPPWAMLGTMLTSVLVATGAMITVLPRVSARAAAARADLIADALLRLRRCAACGYPLAADAEPGDGEHRCSECGALWNDKRLGSTVVPDGPPQFKMSFKALLGLSAACRSKLRDDAGRPYGELPRLTHMNMPKVPGDRAALRATWPFTLLFALGMMSGILLIIVGAILLRGSVAAFLGIGCLAAGIGCAPLAIIWAHQSQKRTGRRALLARRICIACRQRLRRDGEMLHCSACDATWRRVAKVRPPRRAKR